jgi:hypothetical protein
LRGIAVFFAVTVRSNARRSSRAHPVAHDINDNKKKQRVSAVVIILLGLILSFVFPVITLNDGVLWFVGTGCMLVFSGFLNLAVVQYCAKSLVGYLTLINNIICLSLFILSLWVMQEPQVYIGIALFLSPLSFWWSQ